MITRPRRPGEHEHLRLRQPRPADLRRDCPARRTPTATTRSATAPRKTAGAITEPTYSLQQAPPTAYATRRPAASCSTPTARPPRTATTPTPTTRAAAWCRRPAARRDQLRVNALGQRIRKTNSLGDTVFHYDSSGRLIAETDPAEGHEARGPVPRRHSRWGRAMRAFLAAASWLPAQSTLKARSSSTTAAQLQHTGSWPTSASVPGFFGSNYQSHEPNGAPPSAIVVNNSDAGFSVTGTWPTSTAVSGFLGGHYQVHAANGEPPWSNRRRQLLGQRHWRVAEQHVGLGLFRHQLPDSRSRHWREHFHVDVQPSLRLAPIAPTHGGRSTLTARQTPSTPSIMPRALRLSR